MSAKKDDITVLACPVCGQEASGPVAKSVAEVMERHYAKSGHSKTKGVKR